MGDYAVLTENRYSCADSYPGVDGASMMHFYDRRCEPAQSRDTLKISLETALRSFEKEGIGGYAYYGYKAYDQMIVYLSDEAFPDPGLCGYHLRSLLDARHAAYVYLEDCANDDILSGENRSKLMSAAEIFRDMADRMQEAAPYRDLYLDFGNESVTKTFRKKVVAALEMSKESEKDVRGVIAELLANWD